MRLKKSYEICTDRLIYLNSIGLVSRVRYSEPEIGSLACTTYLCTCCKKDQSDTQILLAFSSSTCEPGLNSNWEMMSRYSVIDLLALLTPTKNSGGAVSLNGCLPPSFSGQTMTLILLKPWLCQQTTLGRGGFRWWKKIQSLVDAIQRIKKW